MKKIITGIALFFCTVSFAQQEVIVKTGDTAWRHEYRGEATKINDVVNTKLDVKFDYDKSYMYGKEWLTLHPHFYPTDSLTLDAQGMDINEVAMMSAGKKMPLTYKYTDNKLRINLGKTYKGGEDYTIYIDYVSKPNELKVQGSAAITDAKGLYFINPKGEEKDKPTQIWTQGETEANSAWMPTIDKPNQKSTVDISMTVPSKYVTLSNGLLVNQKKNADGTRTDQWKLDLPIAPYLFFMGVGDYAIIKDSYKGKEVSYYVEKEYAPYARGIFGLTPEMIKFYSDRLGVEYAWPKYSQIVGRDYVSGAMENVTATLHQESAYQNGRELVDGNRWETVIAHELFHHWFGDLVTTESWSNITVNESFADYSQTLWEEYKHGKDAGDEENLNGMNGYLNSGGDDLNLVRFYYKDKEDVFDGVSYQKGGRILNMLRNYVGDDAFFAALKKYLTDNKFKTGEAQQLRLAFESVTGQDLNWYWNQWYYGSGHPVLDIRYDFDDVAGKQTVIVEQKQASGKIFTLPVAVDVYNGANKTRYHVWVKNKIDTFTFAYTQRPTLVNFDADKILLCEKTDHKTADNFREQLKYAPLYMDRREAYNYFAKNHMPELALGLKDKFAGLRSRTLDQLANDSLLLTNESIMAQVAAMANLEKDKVTQSKAIEILANTGDAKYKPLYEKFVNDSSYSVSGTALEGLSKLDPANAYTMAKKYSSDARGKLSDVVTEVIMENGKPEDYDFISKGYGDMPPTQAKLQATPGFADYLATLTDDAKIKAGVDMIIKFRKQIPEQYWNFTDPALKGSLEKLAAAKGGDVEKYINDQLK
ncbi:MAG: M1 family metallopeptidase [Chitinophagaceae bacterium]